MKTEFDALFANPEMYKDEYPITANLVIAQKGFERKCAHEYHSRVAELLALQVINDAQKSKIEGEK